MALESMYQSSHGILASRGDPIKKRDRGSESSGPELGKAEIHAPKARLDYVHSSDWRFVI